jgi:HAMP domain-containing protein/type II secretory pathway pseudopilin PulG
MLKNLRLGSKFNLLLVLVFLIGILLSGTALSVILSRNAANQITRNASILIQTMNAVRQYTSEQVNPELAPRLEIEPDFLPETVPGYSAREVFDYFRSNPDYRDFFYKEATLNPTNPRDRADQFESELVNRFRTESNTTELRGTRSLPSGDVYYIARPIAVSKESCLRCHSTPEAAPASQIATYGDQNGFGWQLNEIVGAQIISVPAAEIFSTAQNVLLLVLLSVCVIFAIIILAINIMLRKAVINPLNRMAAVAHDVSIGKMDSKFQQDSHDEIGVLAAAFERMKLSLVMAMDMLTSSGTGGDTSDR